MITSGLNTKLLVLTSYYIASLTLNVLHISEHQTQPFDDKHIYFFLNTKRHSALLYQTEGHNLGYYTYVPLCNNPVTVFFI